MAESKVLTTDELAKLKEFQGQDNQITFDFGRVELQIQLLEKQKDQLITATEKLTEERNTFGKTLQEKYGDGSINLETGEIT